VPRQRRTPLQGRKALVFSDGRQVEDRDVARGIDPVGDVGDVRGELAEAERLLVRLPGQVGFGHALE